MLSRPHQAADLVPGRPGPGSPRSSARSGLFAGVLLVAAARLALLADPAGPRPDRHPGAAGPDRRPDRQGPAARPRDPAGGEGGRREPRKFVESLRPGPEGPGGGPAEARSRRPGSPRSPRPTTAGSRPSSRKLKKAEAEAAEKAKADREDSEKQREKIKELTAEIDGVLKTPQGELARKYSITWYSAVAGWGLALLADARPAGALGLEDAARRGRPDPAPARRPIEEPPHQIV